MVTKSNLIAMDDDMEERFFTSVENKKVLEPGFLNFLKNDSVAKAEDNMKSFQFNKYDYQGESLTGGTLASTITCSTQSFASCANSNSSPPSFLGMINYDDENMHIDLSPSLDSHSESNTNMQFPKSFKIQEKVQYGKNGLRDRNLPPKNSRPHLPIHSRLAESHTMNSMMRQTKGRMINEGKQKYFKKPPFYTTISKSKSFSDFTTYSDSTCSLKETPIFRERTTRGSPSIFSRLAATETFSSSCLRKSKSKTSTKKPFYTAVGSSNLVKSENQRAKNRRHSSANLVETTALRRVRSVSQTREKEVRSDHTHDQSLLLRNFSELSMSDTIVCNSRHQQQNQKSVYDRLLNAGTISSLQNHKKSYMYQENEKTFSESNKTALLRDFKGSTYVSVTEGPVNKSIIGTVVNCTVGRVG